MALVRESILVLKTGMVVEVAAGRHLRVTDLEGQQVVDLAVFNKANPCENLSTSYSRTRGSQRKGDVYVPEGCMAVDALVIAS
jgi:uncharacterized protein YcgI (DUF1989 family)